MAVPDIDKPIKCPEAFFDSGESSEASQAAFLLSLGALLRSEWSDVITGQSKVDGAGEIAREFEEFPLPVIQPLDSEVRITGENVVRFFESNEARLDGGHNVVGNLVELLYSEGNAYKNNTANAGAILAVTLFSSTPLVRVSAAVSVMDSFSPEDSRSTINTAFPSKVRELLEVKPWPGEFTYNFYNMAIAILAFHAKFDPDSEVEEIAQTALFRLDRDGHLAKDASSVQDQIVNMPNASPQVQTRALVIHGTLAPNTSRYVGLDEWWSPSQPGELFTHIEKKVPRPDIYGEEDTFEWEGNYNARTREFAAKNLRLWLKERNKYLFDVAPHSHGNNLVFLALKQGAEIRNMLAMSCPVRDIWLPPRSQYKKIESVRVHRDLVIMAGRAAQRFPVSMGIKETYVGWFGHGCVFQTKVAT